MRNKKLITLLGSICIILVLAVLPFMGACAAPAPAGEVKIDVLASRMGSVGYVMTFAMADIVNKAHPSLRTTAIETTGVGENMKLMIVEPGMRTNTVFFSVWTDDWMAQQGLEPYQPAYSGMRGIARFGAIAYTFITLDPSIKTMADFAGKRVAVGPAGSSIAIIPKNVMEYGYGITEDDVKISYVPPGPAAKNLADGLVDVAFVVSNIPPPEYSVIPAVAELMALKDVYFIDWGEEAIRTTAQATGYPLDSYIVYVPPASYGPTQPQEIYSIAEYLGWYVDVEMDEEKAYELTKTIYENTEKFAEYHAMGRACTKDTVALLGERYHSGAKKFYKEKGITVD